MLTMFQPCTESVDSVAIIKESESFGQVWTGDPPVVGQIVSLGAESRWEIVKLERFTALEDAVLLAYLKLQGKPTLPEEQWDCWRLDREYGFEGYHLAIYLGSDGSPITTATYYQGEQPSVGETVFGSFERVEGHPTLVREISPCHQIDSIEIYKPEASFYKALHVCRCKLAKELVSA